MERVVMGECKPIPLTAQLDGQVFFILLCESRCPKIMVFFSFHNRSAYGFGWWSGAEKDRSKFAWVAFVTRKTERKDKNKR